MTIDYKDEIEHGDWKPLSSSHLRSVMWLRDFRASGQIQGAIGRMYIEFNERQGRIYLYNNVPYSVFYYLWKSAPSKGRYFHHKLRNEYEKHDIRGRVGIGVGKR